jgi:hypothetical protein
MSARQVTLAEVAEVSGLTRKHIRRMATRAQEGRTWCGAEMRLTAPSKGELSIEFTTLPDHIREAFVMLDREELPLPPYLDRIKFQ